MSSEEEMVRKILAVGEERLGRQTIEYFRRVWAKGVSPYRKRLQAIGFQGRHKVLDVACGYGQWTTALAMLNGNVEAVDIAEDRVQLVEAFARYAGLSNVRSRVSSMEEMPYRDGEFDAIFCYNGIMMADFRPTLSEFERLLKPGGSLYLMGIGLGYFLYQVLETPNQSENYDSRQAGIDAIACTLDFYALDRFRAGTQITVPSELIRRELAQRGFDPIRIGPEGSLVVQGAEKGDQFQPVEIFKGLEGIFEILAEKSS